MDSPLRVYVASQMFPLRQGEIFSDLVQAHLDLPSLASGSVLVQLKVHPFTVILSQDCDLEQDFKARQGQNTQDKLIPNILFCEVITAEQLS